MPNWKKVIVSGSDAHLNTLELTNTTTNDSILVTSTDAGSSAAPVITLKRNSGSPADSDYLGQIKFKGENDADQEVIYSKITGKIQDKADGTEDGIIEFSNIKNGAATITARLKSDKLELLNSTSLEVAGNIDIPDDAILNIGDSDDLQLYHDGSNSYIKDNGTGTIFYRSGTQTFQNAAGSKTMATFNAANSVDLNYNNSTKFQTTNTGISVTGEVVSSGNISGSATSTGSFGRVEAHGGLHIPTVGSQPNGILFGDGDTGFYENADDDFYFKRGGNTVFRANTSSQLDIGTSALFYNQTGGFWIATAAGSAGAPNYAFRGDQNTGMYRTDADKIGFSTGGTLQFEISSNKISGSAASTGSFGHLVIDKDAHIGEDLLADGDVVAYNSSDMRLKNNLQVIGGALDKIDGINGYEFDWNEQSPEWAQERGHDVGVVAQEIQKIHPEIVEERKNGYLGVDYKRLVPLLIQSVKELKQEIDEIKQKCDCLNK